jgi:hypothetical protein
MSRALLLPDLRIENFRGLKAVEVRRLGRVNLITGQNNVGKTSLLEALWLYANRASDASIRQLVTARQEHLMPEVLASARKGRTQGVPSGALRYLFHGRGQDVEELPTVRVGPRKKSEALSLELGYYRIQSREVEGDDGTTIVRNLTRVSAGAAKDDDDVQVYLTRSLGNAVLQRVRVDYVLGDVSTRFNHLGQTVPCQFLRSSGHALETLSALWDEIALSPAEDQVTAALKSIFGEVQRISIIGDRDRRRTRIPIVRVDSSPNPFPLQSLGDGVTRLFGLVLALVNSQGGLLLVDEIETGLHYSIHAKMWRLVFRIAADFNVQVFAITHSWDCIRSFERASTESREDGALIRLVKRREDVEAVLFDEEELSMATMQDIEVR